MSILDQQKPEWYSQVLAIHDMLEAGLSVKEVQTFVHKALGPPLGLLSRRANLINLSDRWLAEVSNPDSGLFKSPIHYLEDIAWLVTGVQDQIFERYFRRGAPISEYVLNHALGDLTISRAVWDPKDALLDPEVGPCHTCHLRNSHYLHVCEDDYPDPTGQLIEGDTCLNLNCWYDKERLFLVKRAAELRSKYPGLVFLATWRRRTDDPLRRMLGAPILEPKDVVVRRKQGVGVVPALIVRGPGVGTGRWVQVIEKKER